VLPDEVGARTSHNAAQHGRDHNGVVKLAGDRYEVGNKVEWHDR
jgi:hypothetical protein